MINFTLMVWLKKYASIVVLLSVFPIIWIVGRNFVTEADTDIYAYIPQESDIVIELNNVNFISEFMYQRIYHEDYVLENIDFEEVEVETGINYFSKIILFRVQWAEENIWIAVISYTDRLLFQKYIQTKLPEAHIAFNSSHAIVQISSSINQAKMDERLVQIAKKEIKPFTARVDLHKYFKHDKEVNCYFIPPTTNVSSQLIDGYLNFDFHQDHVDITGNFTPVSGFESTPSVAYKLNDDAAFSMRSSMNIFNSIYWFSKEKIDHLPEYSQMALDYNGVKMFMVDGSQGYAFPFKSFPEMEARFDMLDSDKWHTFIDTLIATERIRVDTTTGMLVTEQGAFFQYEMDQEVFELSRTSTDFPIAEESDVCFDLQIRIAPLLDNTKFAVDQDNPPPMIIQAFGIGIAEDMIDDMGVLANVEQIKFQLLKDGDSNIKAAGHVQMQNKEGQSIIESLTFVKESIFFISQALDVAGDMQALE